MTISQEHRGSDDRHQKDSLKSSSKMEAKISPSRLPGVLYQSGLCLMSQLSSIKHLQIKASTVTIHLAS